MSDRSEGPARYWKSDVATRRALNPESAFKTGGLAAPEGVLERLHLRHA
jgi:hypothetical protein